MTGEKILGFGSPDGIDERIEVGAVLTEGYVQSWSLMTSQQVMSEGWMRFHLPNSHGLHSGVLMQRIVAAVNEAIDAYLKESEERLSFQPIETNSRSSIIWPHPPAGAFDRSALAIAQMAVDHLEQIRQRACLRAKHGVADRLCRLVR